MGGRAPVGCGKWHLIYLIELSRYWPRVYRLTIMNICLSTSLIVSHIHTEKERERAIKTERERERDKESNDLWVMMLASSRSPVSEKVETSPISALTSTKDKRTAMHLCWRLNKTT